MPRSSRQFAGHLVKENGKTSIRKFCFPVAEDPRQPDWTAKTLIGPAGVMQKDIRRTGAIERLFQLFRIPMEIGDCIPAKERPRFDGSLHDKKLGWH